MNPSQRSSKTHGTVTHLRLAAVAIIVFCILATTLIVRVNIEASNNIPPTKVSANPTPVPTPNMPDQTQAMRIRIILGEKHDLQVATGVDSFVTVSPEIAGVEIKNRFALTIAALRIGETILVITYGNRRHTYIVEVTGKPSGYARRLLLNNGDTESKPSVESGSSMTLYGQGFNGSPSVIRQNVDYRRKLSADKTLRVSGEMFKLFGSNDRNLAFARVQNFSFNRLTVGIDTADKTIDFVDSQINASPLTFNGYTMRGFHMTKESKFSADNFNAKGTEIFAGMARPLLSFFDNNSGKMAGAIIPFVDHDTFQARAGVITISPERNGGQQRGGAIFMVDAAYAPNKEIFADAEMAYSRGDLSWRGRVDLRYSKFGGSAEVSRLALSSPLNSIGAQPGGRETETTSFYWRPDRRLSTSVGFTHTRVQRQNGSQLADYDRSLMFANAVYRIDQRTQFNFRYTDQDIEAAFRGSQYKFAIKTRTFSIGNSHRFNENWSNTIEGRAISSKEARSDSGLDNGFSLNEQLRYTWHGGSATAFVRYTHKTPSLTSLIVRNPQLLPPLLQSAFLLDPATFLQTYRDRLSFLLNGIELPQTRSLDVGVRFQKAFSRFKVMAETRYNAGEIYAVNQHDLYTSATVGVRLDRANSIQISGWKAFGGGGQSGMTASYTHQFGASGDGFRFSNLLGLNRGRVRGRVFYDLNGNGQADVSEPGVANVKIQLDGKRSVTTDGEGRYELTANEGRHKIALVSERLGLQLLASTPTEQTVGVDGRQKLDLNFGVRDHGAVSGRIVNDSSQSQTQNAPGLGGVKVTLRSADTGTGSFALEQMTAANGSYLFSNLRPGKYLIEIDPASIPANYNIQGITGSTIVVEPLRSSYYDVSVAAQRAVTGVVFIDKDGDGIYTYGKDQPVEGASVSYNDKSAVTDSSGGYILRNLPSGRTELRVQRPDKVLFTSFLIELGTEPVTKRSIDIPLDPR